MGAGAPSEEDVRPDRWIRWLSPALLVAGIALVAWAVSLGVATFYLVVIFPVVTGSSALLLGGALLIIAGIFLLPWTFSGAPAEEPESPERSLPSSVPASQSSGGVVLLGPVPLFFGSWRSAPGWAYWLAVLLGSAFLLVFVLLIFGFL